MLKVCSIVFGDNSLESSFNKHGETLTKQDRRKNMKRTTGDPRIASKVVEMVAAHYKTTPAVLKTDEGELKARRAVMYILKEGFGTTLREAREAVNKKSDPDVYLAVKAIKGLLKTDTALATMIEEVKTEVLMLSAMPGGPSPATTQSSPSRQTMSASAKPLPSVSQSETVPTANNGTTPQIIINVQRAVTGVFLGADLLQSSDPAAEVMLAKDAVVFLVWDDFPKISQAEILSAFHIDQDGLYRAVGRILVTLKEDGSELRKKLKAARAAYTPA